MRIRRIPSLLTVSTTILTAGLLISASLETPPNRSSNVKAAPQNTKPSRVSGPQPPSGFSTPLAEQRIAGGYWRIDHTFQPSLIITNVLQNIELPVTPLLYAADGTEYQLSPITLAPAGVASVDIRAALSLAPEETKAHFSDYGSAAVKYVWHWSGAATSLVENRDAKRSLNFNFELRTPMAMKHPGAAANVQEGLWWREDPGVKGFLGLVNVTRHTVDVHVRALSDYGEFGSENRVTLQPNETRNLDILNGIEGSSGGIRLSYDGAEKDIVVAGGLENPQEGYSAQIPFRTISPGTKPSTVTLSSVGLMLGAPDPMMKFPAGTQFGIYLALRNTSSLPILVTPTLYYMDGANPIRTDLKELALAARQAKHWTPQQLATELGLPSLNGMVNLVFSYQGDRNDVIMANGSIDQTKSYVFEIKMEGVSKSLGKGLKDWDVSNGNDTMISLLNPGDKDEDLSMTFYFDDGHYKLPVHLKAGASTMFNVSEIIMMQQPDADGNKIPPGTLHGTAVLAAASAVPQWVNVGVSVGIFNVSTATCGGHCPYCTDFIDFRVQADIGTAPVGQDTEFSSWAESSDYTWIDYTLQSQWTSSNIQVAQPSCCTVGAFTGVSPGSFTATASTTLEQGVENCPEDCNPFSPSASANGSIYSLSINGADLENNNVSVAITGPNGTNAVLTITANGSSNNVQVSANNGNSVGPGTYSLSFSRSSMPADTYTQVTATWSGITTTFALSRQWKVLGLYRHSQYNTPYESACTGTATTAWVFTSSCTFTQTTLRSDFVSQVAVNGSGVSLNYGAVHYEPSTVCSSSRPQGSNDQNSFQQTSTITGSCLTAVSSGYSGTVAVYPNPAIVGGPYVCGDNILEVNSSNTNQALKTVADYCPGCNAGFNGTLGHIDDYSSSQACSAHAVGDFGNFWTADTH